jgi:hypothetical protein
MMDESGVDGMRIGRETEVLGKPCASDTLFTTNPTYKLILKCILEN